MPSELDKRLIQLPKMSKEQLLAFWKQVFETSPPPGLRRDLLIKFLAYRLQEQAFGGLSAETRRRLDDFARKLEANPNANLTGTLRIKPGTRLVRDWQGKSHHVTVLDSGYEYAGKRYPSLSRIARLITGTRWSGPLFFGLRGTHAKEHIDAERS